MTGQAERNSVSVEYRNALGLATWTFIDLEWSAVCVGERLEAGFIQKAQRLTAGRIATRLVSLAEKLKDSLHKERLLKESKRFVELVEVRNNILHAGPAADPNNNNASALYRNHEILTIDYLKQAADDFFDCSAAFNAELYGFLRNDG